MNVLIVEDDTAFQRILQIRLKGWRRECVLTFADCLTAARAVLDRVKPRQGEEGTPLEPFELVILDQHLPDGLGPELFDHPALQNSAVLAVSADDSPELPANAVRAGALHFLKKRQVSEPLFIPLVEAILERKKLESALITAKLKEQKMNTIRLLLATLRHEINNPLGAVLGGAYLIRAGGTLDADQVEAIKLIEASGNRIKDVMKRICEAADLEEVIKANEPIYQIPGDAPWGGKKEK